MYKIELQEIMELDRIDRNILVRLQKNNRTPNIELAELVGLSAPACLKRIKRLRDNDVIIGDVAIVNPELAGKKLTFLVSVEMERDRGDIYQNFRQSMKKAPEITQCYQISGNYDFMLILIVKDIQAYEHFVERVLHTDLNIRKFHTSISLRTIKFSTEIQITE